MAEHGVIRHIGRYAFSGHYIADVRTRESAGLGSAAGKGGVSWKRHDDSVVSKVSEQASHTRVARTAPSWPACLHQ